LKPELEGLDRINSSSPIYIHPLNHASLVDGYDEEWKSLGLSQQSFTIPTNADLKLSAVAGTFAGQVYLFLNINDPNTRYFFPSMPSPLESDHLRLRVNQGRDILVFASGPGRVLAAESEGITPFAPVYSVKGTWLEVDGGYQIELSLPKALLDESFGIQLFDYDSGHVLGNFELEDEAPAPLGRITSVKSTLSAFRQAGLRMAVASTQGHVLAADGSIDLPDKNKAQHKFIPWFYKTVIGETNLPELDDPKRSGKLSSPEYRAALLNTEQEGKNFGWYKRRDQSIVRVGEAIVDGEGRTLGALVLDQSAESLVTMTSGAFYRMLFYSLISTTLAGAILVLYATWLSIRIRKLSQATAAAVSDTGKIAEDFPILRNKDELGDLSRNYAQLLARLREYTNYLRTLSSKLSHELRTPLAIVRSSLDNLEHEELSDQARVYAERAKEGTTRLSNILNAMSAASRVEQAISGAEMENIPCDELLTNLKAAYEDVYEHVEFKLRIRRGDGKLQCWAAGELLVQMLDKLVDNAADFCPENGLIELGLYRHQDHLVFTVHNQGPPLPKHMHGQLFDSMVSVREKGNSEDQGHHLGLGLYIVRLIVDFHRGEVQGYNVPDNSGVIFEVRLPV